MRIAFDHQTFTYQSYGGISRYYTILAEEMLKNNQEVGVFAGLHRNNYLKTLPSGVIRGFKLSKYPPKTGPVFQVLNNAISQVQMKCWAPDIIHETYYSSLPQLNTNSIRVTSVYDMIHELYSDGFSKRDKTTLRKKKTFSRADHIISISHSTKKDLVEIFGIESAKISVVHLGVDFTKFQIGKNEYKSLEKPYLLYVGERSGYKNFSGFLRAFASSEALRSNFSIVAFGGGSLSRAEILFIMQLGLNSSHIMQVSGDDGKLAQLYANAYAFIYPSLYEGFGLPPLEAMAAGCPVVSSNTSSMPEVVSDAGEYFDPKSIDSIRESIEKVIFSDELRKGLISKGFENVKNYSWQKCAKETLKIYKKLSGKV
ncbi:glycosyltransferase family 4 protein [Marinomonas sp.]